MADDHKDPVAWLLRVASAERLTDGALAIGGTYDDPGDETMTDETTKHDPYDGADYYDANEDAESLTHEHPEDAIEAWIEDATVPELKELIDDGDFELQIFAWRRQEPPSDSMRTRMAERVAERFVEVLDDDYEFGDLGGDCTEVTPMDVAAARVFVDDVLSRYKIWPCDREGSRVIDLEPYLREKHPELFVEDPEAERQASGSK